MLQTLPLPLSAIPRQFLHNIRLIFSDLDGTLTTQGKLLDSTYQSLWNLSRSNIPVILVTGRSLGWCEALLRLGPFAGAIGENGAEFLQLSHYHLERFSFFSAKQKEPIFKKRSILLHELEKMFPNIVFATDNHTRKYDIAIDHSEQNHATSKENLKNIITFLKTRKIHYSLSSAHLNCWYGNFSKMAMIEKVLKKTYPALSLSSCMYIGDSSNDESAFKNFDLSIGVANVAKYFSTMRHYPKYITYASEGLGFEEIAQAIIQKSRRTNDY